MRNGIKFTPYNGKFALVVIDTMKLNKAGTLNVQGNGDWNGIALQTGTWDMYYDSNGGQYIFRAEEGRKAA